MRNSRAALMPPNVAALEVPAKLISLETYVEREASFPSKFVRPGDVSFDAAEYANICRGRSR